MRTVKRSWISVLNKIFLIFDVLFFIVFVANQFLVKSGEITGYWGVQPIIVSILVVHFLYGMFAFEWLSKINVWGAALAGNIIMGIFFSSIIEASDGINYTYRIMFGVFVFVINMCGFFTPIAAIGIMWVLYFLALINTIEKTGETLLVYTIINLGVTVAAVCGWFVFKQFYLPAETKEVAQLSGLLKQEQFKANIILDSITDGVMVVNTKGSIQVLNHAAATMLGWTREDAAKLDYKAIIQPLEDAPRPQNESLTQTRNPIEQTLREHTPSHSITKLKTRNDRQLYIDIVASPIYESSPTQTTTEHRKMVGVIAVLRDVDQQKKQEQQRSDFVSTASHEMRTPVASIQGFIELALNKKVTVIDDKARGYLEKAYQSTQHLSELFQDLLTVSKSDDGRLSNQPKLVEINQLLSQIVEQDAIMAKEKNLRVIYENGAADNKNIAPLMYANIDPDRLREVVSNLFENAVKYTAEGMITVGASLKDPYIIIRVSDTGMGIATEDIPHLFQKFYRTDNTKTREIGGTGLGLYISRQIVEAMGGTVWVESTVGEGSTFFIKIPRVDPSKVNGVSA
jgi:PAS domain S-box-containing protein